MIGVAVLVLQSVPFTKTEKVVDLGPIQATTEKKENIPLSPILRISALVVGAGLLVAVVVKKA